MRWSQRRRQRNGGTAPHDEPPQSEVPMTETRENRETPRTTCSCWGPVRSARKPPPAPALPASPRGHRGAGTRRRRMLVPGACPQQGAAAAGRRSRQPPPRGGRRQAVTSRLDTDQVFARRDHYVADWDDSGQAEWFKPIGADLFRGRGRIDGPRQVTVTRDDGAWQPSPSGTRWPSPPAAGHGRTPAPAADWADTLDRRPVAAGRRGRRPAFRGLGVCPAAVQRRTGLAAPVRWSSCVRL